MKISCIIPAYNEEPTIAKIVEKIKQARIFDEIIVVDDGSSDKTFNLAESTGVKVIRHNANKGKGAAIKTGLKNTKADITLFIDADITALDVKKIKKMIVMLTSKKADVVIGTYKFNCYQTFTEVIYKPLMSLFFPEVFLKIKQGYLSGQRGFHKSILKRLHLKDGFDLEAVMNIELTFMHPPPRIAFVDLGDIKIRPKGYQPSMEKIASAIMDEAKKHKRIKRLESCSFIRCSELLYNTIRST